MGITSDMYKPADFQVKDWLIKTGLREGPCFNFAKNLHGKNHILSGAELSFITETFGKEVSKVKNYHESPFTINYYKFPKMPDVVFINFQFEGQGLVLIKYQI